MSAVTSATASSQSPLFGNTGSTKANDATTATGSTSAAGTTTPTSALGSTQTFLNLLVAELRNQDPTQPVDGTQYITQLAQFSQLENSSAMLTDLNKIAGVSSTATAAGTTPVTTSGTNKTGS